MARNFSNLLHKIKPVLVMVLVQAVVSGVNVFYKLAVNDGMSMRVLIAYRFIFATAFVVPLAVIMERKSRPKMTWMIAFQGFLSGLVGGALGQNLYIESLALTSPTFAAAMANLIPAVTFIWAIIFGLEKLAIRTFAGNAKVVGTLLGISGAMILTFYNGTKINLWSTNINLIKHRDNQTTTSDQVFTDQVLGSLLALASCLSLGLWYIIQAKMGERYPCKYSSTALMCITASVQATIYAMCIERDWSVWKLGWNIRLASAAYTGALATGLMIVVMAWCVRKRGPLFVSMFNPLVLIYVALFGSLLLDEKLHLGSILGSVLIIIGLYAVFWGKIKEMKMAQLATSNVEVVVSSSTDTDQITSTTTPLPNDKISKAGEMSGAKFEASIGIHN